eukprot:TRINITY_DN4432_c0_g1_i3.p1 TRINITY_DN4432_c0_g1~~TRINITY_DN4432_c0_g1_i3.p1  ORF type:complete len:422 (-),score=14.29 TRINITY_DN4432_c0_g1_i3:386-1651(-)
MAKIRTFKLLPQKIRQKLVSHLNICNVWDLVKMQVSQKELDLLIKSCFDCEGQEAEILRVLEVINSLRSLSFHFSTFNRNKISQNNLNVNQINAKMILRLPSNQEKKSIIQSAVNYLLRDLLGRAFCYLIQSENWPISLNLEALHFEKSCYLFKQQIQLPLFQSQTFQNYHIQVQKQILHIIETEWSNIQIEDNQTIQLVLSCLNFEKIRNYDVSIQQLQAEFLSQKLQGNCEDLVTSQKLQEKFEDQTTLQICKIKNLTSNSNQLIDKQFNQNEIILNDNTCCNDPNQYQKNNAANLQYQLCCNNSINTEECRDMCIPKTIDNANHQKQLYQSNIGQNQNQSTKQILIQGDSKVASENQEITQGNSNQNLFLQPVGNNYNDNANVGLKFSTILENVIRHKETFQSSYSKFILAKNSKSQQ